MSKGESPRGWGAVLTLGVLLWVFFLILFPFLGILRETAREGWRAAFLTLGTPEALHAFRLTFSITLWAVVLNTLGGTLLAWVLARQKFRGRLWLESLVDLPFAVSPVVAGFMFILLFGPRGWLGPWFESQGIKVVYAFPGMVLATLFVTLPFVAKEILPVLREVGTDQEEAALTLGASPVQVFFRITLPSIRWGLLYGVVLTIARSLGEFGAVLVVSGSIINSTETATVYIHDRFTDFQYAGAFAASLVLAAVSFLVLFIMQSLLKRRSQEER